MNKFIKITIYVFAFILLGLVFGFLTFKLLSFSRTVQMPELQWKKPCGGKQASYRYRSLY